MKKIITLIVFISCTLAGFGQKYYPDTQKREFTNDIRFSGTIEVPNANKEMQPVPFKQFLDSLAAIILDAGSGTVSYVAVTVPPGLTVTGSPITTGGTIVISLSPGYAIPTAAQIANIATVLSWGNHAGLYRPITYVPAWSEITAKPDSISLLDVFNKWDTAPASATAPGKKGEWRITSTARYDCYEDNHWSKTPTTAW